jgi:hypothetical protein
MDVATIEVYGITEGNWFETVIEDITVTEGEQAP